jgi:hypothetical protein
MKSLVSILNAVAQGFLADFSGAYPHLEREFSRDYEKLALHVGNRGLGFFTLDLPSLDAILTDGLETGRLALSGPLSRAVSKKILVPAFLRGLWLRIFTSDGVLRLDPDPTSVAFIRAITCFGKKVTLTCTAPRNEAAIHEFVQIEKELPHASLEWLACSSFDGRDVRSLSFGSMHHNSARADSPAFFEDDRDRLCAEDAHLLERLDTICRDVSIGFGLFDAVEYESTRSAEGRAQGAKNGPGAVSDRSAKEEKYFFGVWPEKLQSVFPIDFFGHLSSEQGKEYVNLEHPSKLILVPKTAKTPRLIASEPSYHQWCQQVVKEFLVDGVEKVFKGDIISFSDQSRSHPLVHTGSLDGSLATIDLSSASDRLSCFVVERAFKANLSLLNAFHACRTRAISRSTTADIDTFFLKKFSTMGSALTFPVQSIFFACAALASLPGSNRLDDQLRRYKGKVRVFGDDIIVPKEGYAGLVRLLTILGLKVNRSKSFSSGRFRESCGYDAFMGYDVTPSKPRSLDPTNPAGRASMIDVSNNLFSKGYWRAARALQSALPQETAQSLPVVKMERVPNQVSRPSGPPAGPVCLSSFSASRVDHLRSRWNRDLHRTEVMCTSYTSRSQTTFTDGKDYTHQALDALSRRRDGIPGMLPSVKSGDLGRVVKAVTRERRSWVALSSLNCVSLATPN